MSGWSHLARKKSGIGDLPVHLAVHDNSEHMEKTSNNIANAIYSSMEEAALIICADFSIESMNRKAKELFGDIDSANRPVKCYELICKKSSPDKNCPLLCYKKKALPKNDHIIESNGRFFKVKISKLLTDNNEVKYVDILHDITNIVQIEKKQKELLEEYQTLNEEYLSTVEELENKNALITTEKKRFELLFAHMNSAFALHEIILDSKGTPSDYRFIECNEMFEQQTRLKRKHIIGRTVLEILPKTEKYWIETYGKVALTGEACNFTNYSKELGKYFEIRSYSPKKGLFAVTFNDITDKVNAEEALAKKNKEYEAVNKEMEESLDRIQQVNTRLEETVEQIESLLAGAREVLEFNSFEVTARKLFDSCKKLTGATSGYVALLNDNGQENDVLFLDSGGLPCSVDESLPMPIRGMRGNAYHLREAVYENDFMNSPHVQFMPQGHVTLKNVLFAPLVIHKKAVGLIGLANKPTNFTDKDKKIVSAFGEQAAIALHNSRNREALLTANDSLKISNEKYKALYDNAPLAYQSLDINGNILDVNPQWLKVLGYKKEEVIGKWFGEFLHPDTVPVFKEKFPLFKKKGVVSGVEYRMKRKNNEIIDVSFEGCIGYDKKGNFRQTYCTFKDITSEKQVQNKLRESVEKYTSLYNYAGIGIGYYSIEGYVVDYNDIALKHLNKARKDVVGKHITDLFPHKEARVYINRMKQTLEGKLTLEFEDEINLPKSTAWFKSSYSVVYSNNNEITGIQIMSIDISNIKQREQEIIEAKNRLAEAQKVGNIGDWWWNIQDNTSHWSDQLFRIYGRDISEGQPPIDSWLDNIYPDDRDKLLTAIENTLKNGAEYDVDYRILRYDNNNVVWINAKGNVVGNNNSQIFRGVAQDITENKSIEKEIQEKNNELIIQNERLESLLRISQYQAQSVQHLLDYSLEEAIKLTNSKIGYIYFYNEKSRKFSLNTWSKEVMKECLVVEPQTTYDLDTTGCWGEAVRQRKPIIINDYIAENPIKKGLPEGHVTLKKFLTVPVFVENSIVAVAGVANKATDYVPSDIRQLKLLMDSVWKIVERTNLVKELEAAKYKAETADKLKSAFLANMSHEIRTPLNGLMGFTEVMATKKNLSEPDRVRYAEIIKKSGEQLINIVNDILDISALENNSLEINKKPFEVNTSLLNIYRLFEQKNQSEQISIELGFKRALSPVELINDEHRFMQVYTNLLDNALKFTQKGSVEFGVDHINNEQIVFFVKDTGIGIDAAQHKVIFDRFRQAELSANRLYGGNGLGLSIVKELLQLMGGDIWLESEKNKGTTFFFSLPYNGSDQAIETTHSIQNNTNLQSTDSTKLKILVVEDDPINQAYMQEILTGINAEYTLVDNGQDAIKMARLHNFDVILMDVRLPDINGFDVTKNIREFDSKIPIIAQTAYAMTSDEEEAYRSGCTDYLSKPIKQDLLLQKLNMVKSFL